MDVLTRIRNLMNQKNWSEYKLSQEANIPQSTINSMFRNRNNPSIYTLQCICKAFNISLSEFFDDGPKINLTLEEKQLIEKWKKLTDKQKEIIILLIDSI
ncbi:MAG: helix-turn-helix domain-containing protein [Longibaculum sp.]